MNCTIPNTYFVIYSILQFFYIMEIYSLNLCMYVFKVRNYQHISVGRGVQIIALEEYIVQLTSISTHSKSGKCEYYFTRDIKSKWIHTRRDYFFSGDDEVRDPAGVCYRMHLIAIKRTLASNLYTHTHTW